MAKDALGHGSDARGAKGAAVGDHQAEQPANDNMRSVPGHGDVPRSQPVAMHNSTPSVGTGGGHGSDNPNMRYVPVGNSGRVRAYNMKNPADAKNYQTHMARNVRRGYPLKDRWA